MILKVTLKHLMKCNSLTLASLSKSTGVPKQTLHNWLTGMEPKNLGHLKSVSSHFGLTIEELCFGELPSFKTDVRLDQFQNEIFAGVFEVVLRRVDREVISREE